eukprot:TRINITY_DN4807_c0_g1_i1.p1 TRINITY_DN4807_c0_g1~~TRINITY_DN4807_c0_g1_i1.p1  ORF type:complete len:723 (+),score=111.74 TRINITY_DN4807_c0_g1_i1:68-2236(+)
MWKSTAVTLLLMRCASGESLPEELTVALFPASPESHTPGRVQHPPCVTVSVSNPTNYPITVSNEGTAFGPTITVDFVVRGPDGENLQYIGPKAMVRLHHVVVPAGGREDRVHCLGGLFDFRSGGVHTVAYGGGSVDVTVPAAVAAAVRNGPRGSASILRHPLRRAGPASGASWLTIHRAGCLLTPYTEDQHYVIDPLAASEAECRSECESVAGCTGYQWALIMEPQCLLWLGGSCTGTTSSPLNFTALLLGELGDGFTVVAGSNLGIRDGVFDGDGHHATDQDGVYELASAGFSLGSDGLDLVSGSCSAAQRASLRTSEVAAAQVLDTSTRCYAGDTVLAPCVSMHEEWFSSFDGPLVERVGSSLSRMSTFSSRSQFFCDADCDRDVVAYVYPIDPGQTIYTCDEHFTWTQVGEDRQLLTVLHELTHFWYTAGTSDIRYGRSRSRELDSSLAVINAENYAFFVADIAAHIHAFGFVPTPTVPPDPTAAPTAFPTAAPLRSPTASPLNRHPTAGPRTALATTHPTAIPTSDPVSNPTAPPTAHPTRTGYPKASDTLSPTGMPAYPTGHPTDSRDGNLATAGQPGARTATGSRLSLIGVLVTVAVALCVVTVGVWAVVFWRLSGVPDTESNVVRDAAAEGDAADRDAGALNVAGPPSPMQEPFTPVAEPAIDVGPAVAESVDGRPSAHSDAPSGALPPPNCPFAASPRSVRSPPLSPHVGGAHG